ncbi:Pyridoxal phosphate-dependent transferase, major domain [Sesbania bispinosa]|nr:Pyridoxal phosphate-dependent transferase, major domain [Sesbania bispinosa]
MKPAPKLVTIVNPGNPTGTYIPEPLLKRISDLCKNAGSWLVVDNTYDIWNDGMAGWISYPSKVEGFAAQLLKVQDNIPICASILSQYLALYSLEMGPQWVVDRVNSLVKNREIILEALCSLGEGSVKGGEGAIYLWAKLPEGNAFDDFEVVLWLAKRHGVAVILGSACGCAGNLRISFGGLLENDCRTAAEKTEEWLKRVVERWIAAVTEISFSTSPPQAL